MTAIAVDVGPRAMSADARQMGFLWSTRGTTLMLAGDAPGALEAALRSSEIFQMSLEQSIGAHAEVELLAAVAEATLEHVDAARKRVTALGKAIDRINPESRVLDLARTAHLIAETSP